jgi:gamma-glutamyltranspeptidase/glutathione hydrolase
MRNRRVAVAAILIAALALASPSQAQRTAKPVLHGRHWVAITGKPLAATAGAMIFQQGGNAVDAACAMLAATATMWDVLGWGGETQALIYDPRNKKVVGIHAAGTPGTPGGLLVMLERFGSMSLAQVLAPAIEMADGYPIEEQAADSIEEEKERLQQWP